MATCFTRAGEAYIVFPGGSIKMALDNSGVVFTTGSEERSRFRWYLDKIKAAVEYIKTGRRPQGFRVGGTEPVQNKDWYLKVLDAARDGVWRAKNEAKRVRIATKKQPRIELGNGLVFITGKR